MLTIGLGLIIGGLIIFFIWLWRKDPEMFFRVLTAICAIVAAMIFLWAVYDYLEEWGGEIDSLIKKVETLENDWRNTPDLKISIYYWMLERNGGLEEGDELIDIRVIQSDVHPQDFQVSVEYTKAGESKRYVREVTVLVGDPRNPQADMIVAYWDCEE